MCFLAVLSTTNGGNSGGIIRRAAQVVPEGEVIHAVFDDTTKKKPAPISRGSLGTAMGQAQPDKNIVRFGVKLCLRYMRMPLKRWLGYALRVPIGLVLSRKPEQAQKWGLPYRSRSQLARDILDLVAAQLPERPLRSLADGGDATKDSVRQLPRRRMWSGASRSGPSSTRRR